MQRKKKKVANRKTLVDEWRFLEFNLIKSEAEIKREINQFIELLKKMILENDKLVLSKIFSIEKTVRKGRTYMNIIKKEKITVPDRTSLKLKVSKNLKKELNDEKMDK